MSHLHERKDKNCLNCNAIVYGRYCHICGQENIETKESVKHLFIHFFQDITHFDGKFFSSLKYLIFHPGFLSREYMVGRRNSYLNPVRFYVFTSFVFFLVFFSLFNSHPKTTQSMTISTGKDSLTYDEIKTADSLTYKKFIDKVVANDSKMVFAYNKEKYLQYLDTTTNKKEKMELGDGNSFSFNKSDIEESSIEKKSWISKLFLKKLKTIYKDYKGDMAAASNVFKDKFQHSIPQLLFVSLPLFALLLKLLYFRCKQFYYVNHAIFAIHFFIFVFVALLAYFGIDALAKLPHLSWLQFINIIIVIGIFFYSYKAMRNFYQQGRGKTILKFMLLNILNFFLLSFLFIAFLLLTIFKI